MLDEKLVSYLLTVPRSAPDSGDVVGATHGVISPKLGTLVRLSPQLSGYGNMSRGFRSVNGVITDPTLVPITAWAYETGVKFEHEGASASLALFRMDVSNEQTLNPVTLQSTSGGASRRQGVEIGWQVSISPQIAASGSWTFNDARYHSVVAAPTEGGGAPRTLDGLHVYNTASYIGAAALDITPGETRLRFRVSGNWVGAYSPFDEPGVLAGGYGLLHLTAVVPMDRFDVETGVRNLLDRAYPELIAGHIVSPGAPRTLLLSLRAHF